MNVGSIVKYYRLRNGLTQAELSNGICSVSHLSKIESNKYSPHKETLDVLFKRMNIEWETELVSYTKYEDKLVLFISHSVYYNFPAMDTLYKELKEDEDYLQSTDLVNKYELYKLRYYLYKKELSKAKRQHQLVEKLCPTFNNSEQIISFVISIMFHISLGEYDRAEEIFLKIDKNQERIPKLFEGEFFYQRAWLLHKRTVYGQSSYFAEMAVQHFKEDCNYIRLMHAQLLLAINFTNRDFHLQADKLYSILLRNTQVLGKNELYQNTLYNYSVLQNRIENHIYAHELLIELKSLISIENTLYDAVLIHLLYTSIEANYEFNFLLEELVTRVNKTKDPYLKVHLKYFNLVKFSQQELYSYCEETMFPFFRKYGYIGEGRRTAWRLAEYFRKNNNFIKADRYSVYYYVEGDKKK